MSLTCLSARIGSVAVQVQQDLFSSLPIRTHTRRRQMTMIQLSSTELRKLREIFELVECQKLPTDLAMDLFYIVALEGGQVDYIAKERGFIQEERRIQGIQGYPCAEPEIRIPSKI